MLRPRGPGSRGAVERRLAKPAIRAVADVEPDQLIAAPAGAQVLRGPDQRGLGGCEGQSRGDDLHLLAGLPVDIDAVGLDLGDRLPARRPVLEVGRSVPGSARRAQYRCAGCECSSSTATCCTAPASNVYNASLAQALARQGHEVHLLCQDRRADELDWVRTTRTITVPHPGHRRPPAGVRRRPLRGLRGQDLPRAHRRGARPLPGRERLRRARRWSRNTASRTRPSRTT